MDKLIKQIAKLNQKLEDKYRGKLYQRKDGRGMARRIDRFIFEGDTPHVYWYDSVGPGCCSWQRFKSICDVND